MALEAISRVEPKRNNYATVAANAGLGAVAGAGLRYILPTKAEMPAVDTFFSSAAMNARGASRSILKYGGIGALVAAGLALLSKVSKPAPKQETTIEYTKLGALIDAPDYACEIMWYGE